MVTRLLTDVQPTLSPARLQRYSTPGSSDLDNLVNYLWNIALAESLYCSLHAVEVALRNSLHDTLTQHFGASNWYDLQGLLEEQQARDVNVIQKRIRDRGNTVTPDRVVSELQFGFWVTILSRTHDARLWRGQHGASIKQAFPRVPRPQRQRSTIHQRYNEIRQLRNRVFHHEPLFDDRTLLARHAAIYIGIRWINPKLADSLTPFDRFPEVYTNGRPAVEAKLQAYLAAD